MVSFAIFLFNFLNFGSSDNAYKAMGKFAKHFVPLLSGFSRSEHGVFCKINSELATLPLASAVNAALNIQSLQCW